MAQERPSYLGLLNGIAVAECRAHAYLTAWADTTTDDQLRATLRTVAAREGEHGMSFAKRIDELGFTLRPRDDADMQRRLAIARSDCSDLEKMEALGVGRSDTTLDVFDGVFKDHSIDVRTGELLGRYIAEEHDTIRRLRACYQALVARCEAAAAAAPANSGTAAPANSGTAALEAKVDALCCAVEELRQIVCAPAMATSAS